jgi:hypothetical protein
MNEVMKQETNLPVAHSKRTENVLASDVLIPKVLLMQGLSDLVMKQKTAKVGDMVRSTTAEKLGDEKSSIDIIPLTFQNLWMLSEQVGKKFEFRRYEPRNASNEMAEWDYTEGNTPWKRTKVMHLFALLPADIEAQMKEIQAFKETGELPSLDKALIPVVIPFRNMSYKHAAKDVATFFAKAQSMSELVKQEVPAYTMTLRLSCKELTNDKGVFYVYNVSQAGKTKPEYREFAQSWYKTLTSGAVKIDEADEGDDSGTSEGPSQF